MRLEVERERVTSGTNIARVAPPDELMAEIRIAETQAKDARVGQSVAIDTRNGIAGGRVTRIDPAVENRAVQADSRNRRRAAARGASGPVRGRHYSH